MKSKNWMPLLLVLSMALISQIVSAQTIVYDDSDGPFSILAQMVTVLSPNGGENWNGGEAHNITWSLDVSVTNVNIDYSIDSGNNWTTVAGNIANSGTYAWTVPATPSLNCLVRVSAAGNAGNNDFSNRVFSISSASTETITAPRQPAGPASGTTGNSYTFSSSGANSNFADALQYKFNWGDGTDSGWLSAGTTSAAHIWASLGTYQVRAMARCATHTGVESPWSESSTIIINNASIPTIKWNAFLGGSAYDTGNDVAVDTNGNVYVTGYTRSTWGSPVRAFSSGDDAFVAKINASGVMVWNTFLGGSDQDWGSGIAVDGSGNIYVTGFSRSTWGSPLHYHSGNSDIFMVKLNADGVLQWNTFLGGPYNDSGNKLAIDGSGNIYMAGVSGSSWGSPLNPYSGGSDALVAKFNSAGALIWHRFIGGSVNDIGFGIDIDNNGAIYVAGYSDVTWGTPLNPHSDTGDIFAIKLNGNGAMLWSTFLGGHSYESHDGALAVDYNGNILIVGGSSQTWGSPIDPFDEGGSDDAFVAKLNSGGVMQWNTFLGGGGRDFGRGIALDHSGNAYITGYSGSTWGTPLNPHSGMGDAFVAELNAGGARQWNTFLRSGCGNGIATDNRRNIYVAGVSNSSIFVTKLGYNWSTLTVTSPNGGENWTSGTTQSITWNSPDTIANINIDYSTDNGGSWIPVAANTVNSGLYVWTVPVTFSTTCLVRVSDALNAASFDASDGVFTIAAVPTLTVIAPNGGESWISDSAQSITWSSTGTITRVNIDYSTNSGGSWIPVAASTSNSGSYAWTVPATFSTTCLVRVSDASNAGNYDVSDAIFSISALPVENITAPTKPSGPGLGLRSSSFSFSTSGSISSFGHAIQYRFDWGDGTDSGWLAAGTSSADHAWAINGTYPVCAMARCATHTGVESPWSESHTVIIYDTGTPILQWHTFLGGNDYDTGYGIAVDNSGNIYITGLCSTTWGSPLYPYSGNGDAFVAKFNAGGVLQWHTFLGGVGWDEGISIAIDNNGNIYITGNSDSTWGSPLNPFGGECDVFLAKLNASGVLQWNTFLGRSNPDNKDRIAIDGSGNIYVMGSSGTTWGSPLNPYGGGDYDTFVAKLNANGSQLWNTFLGGTGIDLGYGIALDASGNVYISGESDSSWGNPLNTYSGDGDAFLAKLDSSGAKIWHTFLGGSSWDIGNGIDIDGSGDIFVVGASLTTWGSPLNPYNGEADAFVAKFNSNGAMQWNTFLGGTLSDSAISIVADRSGNLFIIGYSRSSWGSPLNPYSGGYYDALLAKLDANGIYQWHAFLGGDQMDIGEGIALDGSGNIFTTGWSGSSWGSPLNPYGGGSNDAFVAKIGLNSDSLTIHSPNGGESWIMGTTQSITWSSTGVIANVNIDYSTDNGSDWISLATNEENDGSYSWTIPDTPASACLVRVSDAADAGIYDVSDEAFSISIITTLTISGTITSGGTPLANVVMNGLPGNPLTDGSGFYTAAVGYNWSGTVTPTLIGCTFNPASTTYTNVTSDQTANYTATIAPSLLVTSPNGGEQWQRGIAQTITWISSGVANVKIELLKGTAVNRTITSSTPAAGGSYNWTIPASQTLAANYKIRITSTASSTMTDSSNANFSIFAPSITVTAPVAGSAWQRGATHTITWTWNGTMNASVKILLYKGTKLNATLSTDTPNDGSFDWTIPANQVLATTYKIRITTIDGLVTKDSGTFSITANTGLTVLSPNNRENLPASSVYPIRWTVDPAVREVKLEYSRDNGGSFTLIADNVPNTGYYEWPVPVNFTHNGMIRVSDSYGKYWLNEYGVLETAFNFNCLSPGETEQPDIVVWHGSSPINSPGYGFARVSLGRDSIRMAEASRAIEPLSEGWHEARIRIDLKRDLGTLFIDGKPMLESVALYTSKDHHFEPCLTIQSGNGTQEGLLLSGLLVQVMLLSDEGTEKERFTVMNEDFSGYDDLSNTINSCWQVMGLRPDKPTLGIKTLPGAGRVLWMRNSDGASLTISKPLSIPETIPFDISDRSFIIEMRPEVDR